MSSRAYGGGFNRADTRMAVIGQFSQRLLTLRQRTFFGSFSDGLHVGCDVKMSPNGFAVFIRVMLFYSIEL